MAETRKILGQLNPAATTLTALYTVPGATQVVESTLFVCNQGAAASTFRLSTSQNGAADDPKQYVYYDVAIAGNDTFARTVGVTLGAGDVVRVYAGNGNLSFNMYGVELT